MKSFIGFNKSILAMPVFWQVWVMLLVLGNMMLPFFFLENPESWVILAGILVSMFVMMTLFSTFGFVRLLGLGHSPWLITVPWLWYQWSRMDTGNPFYHWLLAVLVLNSISLVIDAVDVVRYCKGERQPTVSTGHHCF